MSNRILKESICTSENIDQLSAFHETVFYRLLVNCDDYGRMDARPKLLAAKLFPLKDIRAAQIEDALRALTSAELVILYEADGKPFVQMKTWDRHQQVRAKKSKYPAPESGIPANDINGYQMISDDSKCPRNPIQSNTESESNPYPYPTRAREGGGENGIADLQRYIGEPTPAQWEELRDALTALGDHGDELLTWAVKEATDHGARNWAYVRKVLDNMIVRGVKTVEQAQALKDKKSGESSARPKKTVIAQQYEQRDYAAAPEVNDMIWTLMEDMTFDEQVAFVRNQDADARRNTLYNIPREIAEKIEAELGVTA